LPPGSVRRGIAYSPQSIGDAWLGAQRFAGRTPSVADYHRYRSTEMERTGGRCLIPSVNTS